MSVSLGDVVQFLDKEGKEHSALVAGIRTDIQDHLGKDGEPVLHLVKLVPEALHNIGTGNYAQAIEQVLDVAHVSSDAAKVVGWKQFAEEVAEAAVAEVLDHEAEAQQ